MNERIRALEKLANSPNTPPNEAANARRILERLKREAAANGNAASSTAGNAKPPPSEGPRKTLYYWAPGFGVITIDPEQLAELKQMHPQGRVMTGAEVDEWFWQTSGGRGSPRKRTSKKKASAPRAGKKTGRRPRVVEVDRDLNPIGKKKRTTNKVKDGKRKPAPKTSSEKELGFIAKVLRRSRAIKVAVATGDKVVGTWTAQGDAQIRAVLKKALAQAHLLAQRGYETCIAVIHEDGGQTVQCWPE